MQARVPELDVGSAGVNSIAVGQVGIGPIAVDELIVNNADISMSAAHALLRNVRVTVSIHIVFTWHIHVEVSLGPFDADLIDVGDSYDLGSPSFSMPVGDITLPHLDNINVHVPTLTAQHVGVSASPLTNLQVQNLAAEEIQAHNVTLPSAGFVLTGLALTSLQAGAIGLPAAGVDQVTVHHVHGDPVSIPAFTLGSLSLPAAQIPSISSSTPLDIPATMASRTFPFDAGIFRANLVITPSALSHVDHLEITGANASATVGQVVLHNVVLPYDVLNLTLSQVGINAIEVPTFSVT